MLNLISEISLGVSLRALSRAADAWLGARGHPGEALCSASSPNQKSPRSCFARAPSRSQLGDNLLRELRLALVLRLGSSVSWLRRPCFEVYRKTARKLLMRHPIVVLGPTFHVYKCSLVRVTGPFSSHGSFFLVKTWLQRKRPGKFNFWTRSMGRLINRTSCFI